MYFYFFYQADELRERHPHTHHHLLLPVSSWPDFHVVVLKELFVELSLCFGGIWTKRENTCIHISSYLQHLFHVCPWCLIKLEYKNSKSCVDRVVGLWSLTFRPQSACYHGGSVSQAFIGQRFISLLECPVLKIFSIYSEDKLLPAFLVINTVTMTGSSREKSYYLLFWLFCFCEKLWQWKCY